MALRPAQGGFESPGNTEDRLFTKRARRHRNQSATQAEYTDVVRAHDYHVKWFSSSGAEDDCAQSLAEVLCDVHRQLTIS